MSHASRGFCATGVSSGQNHRLMAHNFDSEPIRTCSRITPRSTGGAGSWVLTCWTAIAGSRGKRKGKAGAEQGGREGAEGKSSVCAYTCGNAKKQCSCSVLGRGLNEEGGKAQKG